MHYMLNTMSRHRINCSTTRKFESAPYGAGCERELSSGDA